MITSTSPDRDAALLQVMRLSAKLDGERDESAKDAVLVQAMAIAFEIDQNLSARIGL